MKTEQEIQAALAEYFEESDIEWKPNKFSDRTKKAQMLAYVTNRAIMKRLDEVCGIANWKNEFQRWGEGGVLCGISIRLPNSVEWITKWDGADESKIEETKGGLSGAMKRAAVQWGIGRYLYELGETWVPAQFPGQGESWKPYVDWKDYPKLASHWLPRRVESGAAVTPAASASPKAPVPASTPPAQAAAPQEAKPKGPAPVENKTPPDWIDNPLPSKDFAGDTWRSAMKSTHGGRHHHWIGWMAETTRLKPRDKDDGSPEVQMMRARSCLYALQWKTWPTGLWSFKPEDFPFAYAESKPATAPSPSSTS